MGLDPFFLAGGASALSPAPGSQDSHLSQPGEGGGQGGDLPPPKAVLPSLRVSAFPRIRLAAPSGAQHRIPNSGFPGN